MDILSEAIKLLGSAPAEIYARRGWAHWFCPFHEDTGRPNFGLCYRSESGYWKCLSCNRKGPSLRKLAEELVKVGGYAPPPKAHTRVHRPGSQVSELDEALTEARFALRKTMAWQYLTEERKVSPATVLMYGLGFGIARPNVHLPTLKAAQASNLAMENNWWLWADGIVYAEPLSRPKVIQVRHLRKSAKMKYQTWGEQLVPFGSWRINDDTHTLIVLEGMIDLFITAQELEERSMSPGTIPVYTGGANPSFEMLEWFRLRAAKFNYVLVPDSDEAGFCWMESITKVLETGGGRHCYQIFFPPDNLDPDEAILAGWWPQADALVSG